MSGRVMTVAHEGANKANGLSRLWQDNALSIVCFGLFLLFLLGQSGTGLLEYNQDAKEHGEAALSYWQYLISGHFIESVFENWESEFLQMGAYVLLTSCLVQRGSAESRKPDEENPQDQDPSEERHNPKAPGPVRAGGAVLMVYQRSLSLSLFLFFLLSMAAHAIGGTKEYNSEQLRHGEQGVSLLEYFGTSRFWFESFQNWQSEFLAVFVLVVLSIWLREKGSPESKPVAAAHSETGAS